MSTCSRALLVWTLSLAALAPIPASGADPIAGPAVDEARRRVDQGYYPGIVIGIVDAEGTRFFAHGEVDRSKPDAGAPDAKSIFEIGSITKAFTGILLADAVRRGEVSLSTPIEELLPEGVGAPRRGDRSITLLDLATQTSGLPRLPDNLAPEDPENPYADYTVDALHTFLSGHELRRDIGATYEYSNLGVGLLGHLLALRAGISYEELVRTRIARPLKMNSTTITLDPAQRKHLALGHQGAEPVPGWDLPTLAGAGALRSSAEDMTRFLAANLGLLESPLLDAMRDSHEPRHGAGSETMKIGLCWHVRQTDAKTIVWHNGGTGGYRTFAGFVADDRRAVVVLTNGGIGADDLGFHLLDSSTELTPALPDTVSLEPGELERLEGYFELRPGFVLDFRVRNGFLTVQPTGQTRFTLHPASKTEFRLVAPVARCVFEEDEKGGVTSIVWHQGGGQQKGQKLTDYTPPGPRQVVAVDRDTLETYVGQYTLRNLVFTVTRDEDQLHVQLTGQPRFPVYAESKTKFFYKVVEAQITFATDEEGKVTHLTLHQGGLDQKALRQE